MYKGDERLVFGRRPSNINQEPVKRAYEIICPYCFKRYEPKDVVFRIKYSIPNDENFKKKKDKKLNIYRSKLNLAEINEIEAVIDPVENSNLVKMRDEKEGILLGITDINDEYTNVRLCPHCHKDLPITAGKGPTKVISVIGGPSVGKSVYMTVLINTIQKITAMNFRAGSLLINTQYLDIIRENENMLYKKKEVLPPSPKETRIEPLVLSLNFLGANRSNVTLIFYDIAGEGMEDEQYMNTHGIHVQHSDGIIFLVDPLKIDVIREKINLKTSIENNSESLDENSELDSYDEDEKNLPADFIVTMLFQNFIGNGIEESTDIPTAIVLTKSDMLKVLEGDDINKGTNMFENYKHKNILNAQQLARINMDVFDFLKNVYPDFLSSCTVFNKCQFFAVSSLGTNPVNKKIKGIISPVRVDEPLLYLLYKWGIIYADTPSIIQENQWKEIL